MLNRKILHQLDAGIPGAAIKGYRVCRYVNSQAIPIYTLERFCESGLGEISWQRMTASFSAEKIARQFHELELAAAELEVDWFSLEF